MKKKNKKTCKNLKTVLAHAFYFNTVREFQFVLSDCQHFPFPIKYSYYAKT